MYDESSEDAEGRKNRRLPKSRVRAPRASRATKYGKKPPGNSFGGVHRRHNKHWNW